MADNNSGQEIDLYADNFEEEFNQVSLFAETVAQSVHIWCTARLAPVSVLQPPVDSCKSCHLNPGSSFTRFCRTTTMITTHQKGIFTTT